MAAEPLIHRDELTAYLFTVADIRDNPVAIRRIGSSSRRDAAHASASVFFQ